MRKNLWHNHINDEDGLTGEVEKWKICIIGPLARVITIESIIGLGARVFSLA